MTKRVRPRRKMSWQRELCLQRRIEELEHAVELLAEILGERLPDERLAEVVAWLSDEDANSGIPPQSPPVPPCDGALRTPSSPCSGGMCGGI